MKMLQRFKNQNEYANVLIDKHNFFDDDVKKVTPALVEEFIDHVLIDKKTYSTCLLVGVPPDGSGSGLPRNLSNTFVDQLIKIENTEDFLLGLSYCCFPVPGAQAKKLVDDALYANKISRKDMDKATARDSGVAAHSLDLDFESKDYVFIYEQIYNNLQRLFDYHFIVTIWSDSKDGLDRAVSVLDGVLKSNMVQYEIPYNCILETYMSAQPYPGLSRIARQQQLSNDAGELVPLRNSLNTGAETGLIYGLRKSDGQPFVIDIEAQAAGHHIIIGGTGSGKTVTMMKILMTCHDMLGHKFVYITPKSDAQTNYKNVARSYKDLAQIVNLGVDKDGMGQNINPLQVIKSDGLNTDEQYISLFNDHLELVTAFFAAMDTSSIMDDYVIQSVIELYRKFGIRRREVETWKDLPGDKWPVLLDLRDIWNDDLKNKNRAKSAEAMLNRTSRLETSWEYINQPTNVELDKEIIVVDISRIPGTLQDAMNVFVTGFVGMRFNADVTKRTDVLIDEGRVFLNNKKLADFIIRLYTQGRSAGMSCLFGTQNATDFKDEEVRELFKNNSFVNIIMGNVRKNSYESLQKFFILTEDDMALLRTCGVGEGLIQVGHTTTAVKFELTEYERKIILNSAGQLAEDGINEIDYKLKNDKFKSLIEDEDVIISDWISGDPKKLAKNRKAYTVQRVFKKGATTVWIKPHLVKNGKIGHQSIDHYATVLQIASYLLHRGCSVEVKHNDDTDILAVIKGRKLAIEYERPGSHAKSEIREKNQRNILKYGSCLFVCTSENYKIISDDDCVGVDNTVIRGVNLREYLDQFLSEKTP